MTEQIATLKGLRRAVADLGKRIAERELEARTLRLGIEAELRKGATKSDAEKFAPADPRYLAHQRETIGLTRDRENLWAEAEAQRLGILFSLAELEAEARVTISGEDVRWHLSPRDGSGGRPARSEEVTA